MKLSLMLKSIHFWLTESFVRTFTRPLFTEKDVLSVCLGFLLVKIFLNLKIFQEFFILLNLIFLFFLLLFFLWFVIKIDRVLNKPYLNFNCLQSEFVVICAAFCAAYLTVAAVAIYFGVDTRSSSANTIWSSRGPGHWKVLYDPPNLRFYVPSYYIIMAPKGAVSPLAVAAPMPTNLKPLEFWFYMHGKQGILAPCLGQ